MPIKKYDIEELLPFPDYVESGANGTNSNGQCVGASAYAGQASSTACTWDNASLIPISLGLPNSGSTANAVADDGSIVGHWHIGSTVHAFLILPGGTWELLEPLTTDTSIGEAQALGFGVQPIGWCESGPRYERVACIWNTVSKKPTALGKLQTSDISSTAYAGNKLGQVVGVSVRSGSIPRGFLWTPGGNQGVPNNPQMEDLGTLGGNICRVFGINNLGQVVGESETINGETHAFLWTRGGKNGVPSNPQMEDLGTLPGHTSSTAIHINNNGDIFGYSRLSSTSAPLAFISDYPPIQWKEGPLGFPIPVFPTVRERVMTDLNTLINPNLGWILRNVGKGNDKGEIVGWGERLGNVHGFRLKPMKPIVSGGLGWPIISSVVALLGSSIAAGGGGWVIDLVTGRIRPEPPPVPWMLLAEETRNQIGGLIVKDLTSHISKENSHTKIHEIITSTLREIEKNRNA
jgi:probable HAF family extracellular repeat protein